MTIRARVPELTNGATNGAKYVALEIINKEVHNRVLELFTHSNEWINRGELFAKMSLSNQSANRQKFLDPLLRLGWIKMEHPDNETHPKQRYKITVAGFQIFRLLTIEY